MASVRPGWWYGAAEERFDGFQQARQCLGFRRGQVGEECSQFGSHQVLRGLERCQPCRAEGDVVAASVVAGAGAVEQVRVLEAGEHLGDGGGRDGGAACQVRADQLALGDGVKREVLGVGERRVVSGQQSLHPATDEWGDAAERFGRVFAAPRATVWVGRRHG